MVVAAGAVEPPSPPKRPPEAPTLTGSCFWSPFSLPEAVVVAVEAGVKEKGAGVAVVAVAAAPKVDPNSPVPAVVAAPPNEKPPESGIECLL